MNFIDVFNFSKYFKREGDGKRAKIGHVNEVIEELTALQDTVDNLPEATVVDGVTITGAGTALDPLVANVSAAPNYKVLTATVSQVSTDAPTMTILENTFGVTPTWNYVNVGQYQLVFPSSVITDYSKVWIYSDIRGGEMNAHFGMTPVSNTGISANVFLDGNPADNWLYFAPIEIRIYN